MNKKVLILALLGVFASGSVLAQQAPQPTPSTAPTTTAPTVALSPSPVEAPAPTSSTATIRSLDSLSDDNLIRSAARKNVRKDALRSEAELIAAEGKLAQAELNNQLGTAKIQADLNKAKQGPTSSGGASDSKAPLPASVAYREPAPVLYAIYGSGSNMVAEIYLGRSKWVAQTGSVSYSGLKVVSISDSQVVLLDKKGKKQVLFVAGSVGS